MTHVMLPASSTLGPNGVESGRMGSLEPPTCPQRGYTVEFHLGLATLIHSFVSLANVKSL